MIRYQFETVFRKERQPPRARWRKAAHAEDYDEADKFGALPQMRGGEREAAKTAASAAAQSEAATTAASAEAQSDADTFGTLSSEWNEKASPAFNFAEVHL